MKLVRPLGIEPLNDESNPIPAKVCASQSTKCTRNARKPTILRQMKDDIVRIGARVTSVVFMRLGWVGGLASAAVVGLAVLIAQRWFDK